jgi:hypothetical protein
MFALEKGKLNDEENIVENERGRNTTILPPVLSPYCADTIGLHTRGCKTQ